MSRFVVTDEPTNSYLEAEKHQNADQYDANCKTDPNNIILKHIKPLIINKLISTPKFRIFPAEGVFGRKEPRIFE
jgi:hypothetical protein